MPDGTPERAHDGEGDRDDADADAAAGPGPSPPRTRANCKEQRPAENESATVDGGGDGREEGEDGGDAVMGGGAMGGGGGAMGGGVMGGQFVSTALPGAGLPDSPGHYAGPSAIVTDDPEAAVAAALRAASGSSAAAAAAASKDGDDGEGSQPTTDAAAGPGPSPPRTCANSKEQRPAESESATVDGGGDGIVVSSAPPSAAAARRLQIQQRHLRSLRESGYDEAARLFARAMMGGGAAGAPDTVVDTESTSPVSSPLGTTREEGQEKLASDGGAGGRERTDGGEEAATTQCDMHVNADPVLSLLNPLAAVRPASPSPPAPMASSASESDAAETTSAPLGGEQCSAAAAEQDPASEHSTKDDRPDARGSSETGEETASSDGSQPIPGMVDIETGQDDDATTITSPGPLDAAATASATAACPSIASVDDVASGVGVLEGWENEQQQHRRVPAGRGAGGKSEEKWRGPATTAAGNDRPRFGVRVALVLIVSLGLLGGGLCWRLSLSGARRRRGLLGAPPSVQTTPPC